MTAKQIYMVARKVMAVMAMAVKIIIAIVATAVAVAIVIVAERATKARVIVAMVIVVKMITARELRTAMARAITENVEMEGVGNPMGKCRNKNKMKSSQLTWEIAEGMNEGESKDLEGSDEKQHTWRVAGWNNSNDSQWITGSKVWKKYKYTAIVADRIMAISMVMAMVAEVITSIVAELATVASAIKAIVVVVATALSAIEVMATVVNVVTVRVAVKMRTATARKRAAKCIKDKSNRQSTWKMDGREKHQDRNMKKSVWKAKKELEGVGHPIWDPAIGRHTMEGVGHPRHKKPEGVYHLVWDPGIMENGGCRPSKLKWREREGEI